MEDLKLKMKQKINEKVAQIQKLQREMQEKNRKIEWLEEEIGKHYEVIANKMEAGRKEAARRSRSR